MQADFAARMKGRFETLAREISESGGIEDLPRKALRVARRIARDPKAVAGFGRTLAETWRGDGASAVVHRIRYEMRRHWLPESYRRWVALHDTLAPADRDAIRARIERLPNRPLVSVLLAVDDGEERMLRCSVESVRGQLYPGWELCIAATGRVGPRTREILEQYRKADGRIQVVERDGARPRAEMLGAALEMARGEYVVALAEGDELREHALYLAAEELAAHPEADLVYGDEDELDAAGERSNPHFKGEWNPDLFLSRDCLGRPAFLRASVAKRIGGYRAGYDGSEEYELALRFTAEIAGKQIRHVPHVLYHRREGWRRVRGVPDGRRVTYPIPGPAPKVSLLMPTRDRGDLVEQAVRSILERTEYPDFEILIIDNGSTDKASLKTFERLAKDPRVRVLRYDHPFNYSAINNYAAGKANGNVLCLVNNDVEVISREWLRELVSHALRPEVGAVGAKLLFPDRTIQHAGVILGIVGGVAEHGHRRFPASSPGYFGRLRAVQRVSAVTGACLAVRRTVYEELGGLDTKNLAVAYNDIDFCLRLREKGYAVVWTPHAELFHHESASRGSDAAADKRPRAMQELRYMKERWGEQLSRDPYYSPNLTLKSQNFSYAFPPRAPRPWRG